MKKLICALFVCCMSLVQLNAQNDTVSIQIDDWSVIVGESYDGNSVTVNINFGSDRTKKNVYTRWGLMDLGFDILNVDETIFITDGEGKSFDPLEMKVGKSMNVNIHIVQQRMNLINHKLNLVYGLSLESHKYELDAPLYPVPDDKPLRFDLLEEQDESDIKKNRLSTSYLTIPLMLNFESNPSRTSRSLHITAGVFGGPLLGAHFKVKEKGEGKNKVKDNYNISKWRYGVRAEAGYGPVTLYGQYSLNELFDEDNNGGYIATPLSIGIVLIPF